MRCSAAGVTGSGSSCCASVRATRDGPFVPTFADALRRAMRAPRIWVVTEPLVVRRRAVAIAFAALPAATAAVLLEIVRETPPTHVLLPVVAAAAGATWLLWRLLSARIVVREDGLLLRGVTEDSEVPWSALADVTVDRAPRWARLLLWGLLDAYVVTLHLADGVRLRPVALWANTADEVVAEAVAVMRVRVTFPAAHTVPARSV